MGKRMQRNQEVSEGEKKTEQSPGKEDWNTMWFLISVCSDTGGFVFPYLILYPFNNPCILIYFEWVPILELRKIADVWQLLIE